MGLAKYVTHDKGGVATIERVAETETFNLHTDDIEKAAKHMAWTDGNRELIQKQNGGAGGGRTPTAGNTYHFSLAWHPDDDPSWQHMRETGLSAIDARDLGAHQFYFVRHTDEAHSHMHIAVNLVHPQTGQINNCWKDRDVLDAWANEYEKEHGIQCENRAQKYEAWEQDKEAYPERQKKSDHTDTVTRAFRSSDSGTAFQAALEADGLTLAQGKRRAFVVVDCNGDVSNLTRCIEFEDGTKGRGKTKAINERLADLDRDTLPQADSVTAERRAVEREQGDGGGEGEGDQQNDMQASSEKSAREHAEEASQEAESVDLDALEVAQQKALVDAAERAAEERTKEEAEQAAQAERGRADERAAGKAEQRAARERQNEQFRKEVETKTAESRSRWQIDELTARKVEAEERVDALGGFWAKVFKRSARKEAFENLYNAGKQLEERETRFQADVDAYKAKRPDIEPESQRARPTLEPEPKREPEPKPEPEAERKADPERPPKVEKGQQPPPKEQAPEASPPDDREAQKQAYLDRQAAAREQQRDEPEQDRGLERD